MRLSKHFCYDGLVVVLLLVSPGILLAQSLVTGGITGAVTDPTGSVIVGATVNLKSNSTGEIRTTTTGSSGTYQFTLLKPGSYVVSATRTGFKQTTETIEVLLGQITSANMKLELGTGSTTVEVTSQGALLQTEDANISSNFNAKQIQDIPNPGGDITYVAQTAPGVTMNNSMGGGYGNFSAFGLPATSNLFTVRPVCFHADTTDLSLRSIRECCNGPEDSSDHREAHLLTGLCITSRKGGSSRAPFFS